MPDRFGLGGDRECRFRIVQHRLEFARHQAVVGRVVGDPKALGASRDATQHQVHPFRPPPLHGPQQVGVHADLEHGRGRGFAGQLGVPNFIAPRPEGAGPLDAAQEVRVPESSIAEQHRLEDHVDAVSHGLERGVVFGSNRPGRRHGVGRSNHLHVQVLAAQRFQEARLILVAAPRQAVQHGIVAMRAPEVVQSGSALQVGQVPALQETDQVRGRVDQAFVDQLHRGLTRPSPWPAVSRGPRMRSA